MKNLLTLLAIFFGLEIANAQTFDETVNYINQIFEDNKSLEIIYFHRESNTGRVVENVKVEKNGRITFLGKNSSIGSFNIFDFEKIREDYAILYDKNNQRLGYLDHFPKAYVSKIEKALKHLKTLCVKEKDPFE